VDDYGQKARLEGHIPTEQHVHKNHSSKSKMLSCHVALSPMVAITFKKDWKRESRISKPKVHTITELMSCTAINFSLYCVA
jgi:hypothetical protein